MWAKGLCTGMTARQVRGLQKNATRICVHFKDGATLVNIRVVPGVSEEYVAWTGGGLSAGAFALADVATWYIL